MQQRATMEDLLVPQAPKYVFVSGKGGVGKTTCSAALAVLLGSRGFKTLLMSTDPAHNLGDALKLAMGAPGSEVAVAGSNVTALEVDPKTALEARGQDELSPELSAFVSSMPGIDEAMALSTLHDRAAHYDRIVIDTAPTGHTLRLLALPTLLGQAIERLSGLDAKLGTLYSLFTSGEDATAKLKQRLAQYKTKCDELAALFRSTNSTFVCVCIAEHLSVFETARLVRHLREQRIQSKYVLVNQLLPALFTTLRSTPQLQGRHFPPPAASQFPHHLSVEASGLPDVLLRAVTLSGARARIQAGYLWQLEQALGSDMTIVRLPMEEQEVRGLDALRAFCRLLLEPRTDLYATESDASQDQATLSQLQETLRGPAAAKAAVAVDPIAMVMKLLSKPNGIASLCVHPAVSSARQADPKMDVFFKQLELGPAGLMSAYLMLGADPSIKAALMQLAPQVADLLQ